MESLKASAQYNDWVGDAAADSDVGNGIEEIARARGALKQGEFLLALSAFAGDAGFFTVSLVIIDAASFDDVPGAIAGGRKPREVHLDITRDEFFRCFKRFSIAIRRRGLDLSQFED